MFSNFYNCLKDIKSQLLQLFLILLVLILFFETTSSQDILPNSKQYLKFEPFIENRKVATESYKQSYLLGIKQLTSKLTHSKALFLLQTTKNNNVKRKSLSRKRRQLFGNPIFPISEGFGEGGGRFSAGDRGVLQNQIPNKNQFADPEHSSVITPIPEFNSNPFNSFNGQPFTGLPRPVIDPYDGYPEFYRGFGELVPGEGSGALYDDYEPGSRRIINRNVPFPTTTTSQIIPTTAEEVTTQRNVNQTTVASTKVTTQTIFNQNLSTSSSKNTLKITTSTANSSANLPSTANMTTHFTSLLINNTNNMTINNISFGDMTVQKNPHWVVRRKKILLSVLIPVIFILIVIGLAGLWICFFAKKWKTRRVGIEMQPKNGNRVLTRDPASGSSARSSHSDIGGPKVEGNGAPVEAWSQNSYHIE